VIWDPDGEALPAGQLRSTHVMGMQRRLIQFVRRLQPGFSPDWWSGGAILYSVSKFGRIPSQGETCSVPQIIPPSVDGRTTTYGESPITGAHLSTIHRW
jgi:hypothetical protein